MFKLRTCPQKRITLDQISHSVMSDSLRPHESQHSRPPCPSLTPGVHWDSRPSSQWCHPAISSSVVPFSSCPQSLPASESFPMSQLFAWGSQSTGVSHGHLLRCTRYDKLDSENCEKIKFNLVVTNTVIFSLHPWQIVISLSLKLPTIHN